MTTHLISLSMKGFKSFGKQISVRFSPNMTGVVGPNGSGKSNIADGICFVLGRASMTTMRAKKGSDLIFNGAKKWKPSPYAEVKLVLDNTKAQFGAENGEAVTVSRRVHPDGVNSYRINGQRCTKNQMLDLLAMQKIFPNGHNIVLQGDIGQLIKMNMEERRKIIDEIAGIEEYEDKKHKALLEFDAVARRIAEVDMLMREKQRQLDRLKQEKEEAERYKKLETLKKIIDASITKRKKDDAEKERERATKELAEIGEKSAKANARIDEIEKMLIELRRELVSLDKKLSSSQSNENFRKAADAERLEILFKSKTAEIDRLAGEEKEKTAEQERLARRVSELEKLSSELKARIKAKEAESSALTKELEALEKRREEVLEKVKADSEKRSEVERQLGDADAELEVARTKERETRLEAERMKSNEERMAYAAGELKTRVSKIEERSKNIHGEKKELEEAVKRLTLEKSRVKGELTDLSGELKEAGGKAEAQREIVRRLESELHASRAGNPAANMLIKAAEEGKVSGIVGKLKDFAKSDAAIVASFDDPNALVVGTFDDAKEIVSFINERKLGRVTLVLRSAVTALKAFDSIDAAFSAGEGVTRDGILVRRGVIVAGQLPLESGLGSQIDAASKSMEALRNHATSLGGEIETRTRQDYNLFLELQKIEIKLKSIASFEPGEIASLENEMKGALASAASYRKQREEKEKALKALEAEVGKLSAKRAELAERDRPAVSLATLTGLDNQLKPLREREQEARAEFQNMKIRLESSLLPELADSRKRLPLLEKEREELKIKLTKTGTEQKKAEQELAEVRAILAELTGGVTEMIKRKKEGEEKRAKLEEEKYKLIGDTTGFKKELKLVGDSVKGLDDEIADLAKKLGDHKVFMEGSVNSLSERLYKVEARLQRMGAVNLMAIDQFGTFEDEFREIDKKKQKLEEEKQSIINFMNEVETRKKGSFMENFTKIAAAFEKVYKKLTGGEGRLLLENPETVFDGGLIIQASPKGKEVSRIDSMSGGEKTITAIAFITSIQEHRPAPFYIFDEVDAALDKQNSDMLAKLFADYSRRSQFIVVTHNDAVVRECDQLVGVHLSDGMSRIVSAEQNYIRKTS